MNTFFYFIKNTLNLIRYIPLLFFLFSCEKNNEYTVSVEVLPVESGSIDFLNKFYNENDDVYLKAFPNEHYEFDFWSGDVSSNQTEINFKINHNVRITANFKMIDSDNDGVPDKDDLCPDTDIGVEVNESGCSHENNDYDNDGIFNKFDNCPETPENTTVNEYGCSFVVLDDNQKTLKAESFSKDYTDTVILFNGDSILIVDDWKSLRSLGPSSYKRDVKIVTTFVEEMREFCSLPCKISDDFDMSTWDLSNVKLMFFTFWNTNGFNQDISDWDVSKVESMEGVFFHAYNLNVDVSKWDVSNVISMKRMFRGAFYANPDVSQWDVSKVTNMLEMFYGTDIAQDLKNWDVSNVTNMEKMFYDAKYFNQDLSIWDVGNVTECNSFYENTESWSLPKPSFIKCNPDG